MSFQKRLQKAFRNAEILPLKENINYICFSDCHRGTGHNNDEFEKNQSTFYYALHNYYCKQFHYVELGDGEELWENRHLDDIKGYYSHIYELFDAFKKQNRLHKLYGNHDMELKDELPESIILENKEKGISLYLTHGHQADLLNSRFWVIARFLVRYLWKPLNSLGIAVSAHTARNNKKLEQTDLKLALFGKTNSLKLIAGHTHKARVISGNDFYYNTGSCISPRCIIGIEITGLKIALVTWCIESDNNGMLGIHRHIISGPFPLKPI